MTSRPGAGSFAHADRRQQIGNPHEEVSIYDQASGYWPIAESGTWTTRSTMWGWEGGTPVSADYDGDGKDDLAIYTSAGMWYIAESSSNTVRRAQWGRVNAEPVPANYDGDPW